MAGRSSQPSAGRPGLPGVGRRGLDPLWDELAQRMGASRRPVAAVTLRDLDEGARQALADLFGWDRLPAPDCRVRVDHLAAALGVDGRDGVRAVVESVRGPLPDRAAERTAQQAEREELWSWLAAEAAAFGADGWAARVRAAGIPGGDVAAHRRRLEGVAGVLARLPADAVPLAVLASDTLGDPHALDAGRWATGLVLDAVACRVGRESPKTAEERRSLWAEAGVVADPLSPTVLVLALRPVGDDPLAVSLRTMAEAFEAAAVTVAQLQRWPVCLPAGAPERPPAVYVVENPSLLSEAARRRWCGPPLVCTSGWPSVAAVTLLRQLGGSGAGVVLRQHADLDPAGLEISRHLTERVGTVPWRMTAADYEAAVSPSGTTVTGPVPPTPWDPALAEAMARHRRAVYEEDVVDALLEAALELD